MDIHWFDDGGEWIVVAIGRTPVTFPSRRAAFAEARRLAQSNPPSRLINAAPVRHEESAPGDRRSPTEGGDEPTEPSGGPTVLVGTTVGVPDHVLADEPPDDAPPHDDPRGTPVRQPSSTADRGAPDRRPSADRTEPPPLGPTPRPSSLSRPRSDTDWVRLAGPAELGRSLLLPPGAAVPPPWSTAPEIDVEAGSDDPGRLLDEVRAAFLARQPTVYRLDAGRTEPVEVAATVDVWTLPVEFEFTGEATWALLTANAVDARGPTPPHWPWAELAIEAGATEQLPADQTDLSATVAGEVVLPDGRTAWCDGGPTRFWEVEIPDAEPSPRAAILPRLTLERGRLDLADPGPPSADLATDQLEAVGEQGARARIIAPAGSGKTRVLTERARYLLTTKHLPPAALTLVAFNKRAQLEMQARTRDLPGLQIQTLNALALAILNGGRGFRVRDARVRTIDEIEVRRLLSELVKFPRRANTDPAAAWIDALSTVRLGLRPPQQVEAEFSGDVDGFTDFFPQYRRHLLRHGLVDFDDQIYRAIEVLLAEPETRRQAQHACRLLMVDEFQDLTPAHLLLIRLLAGPELNVFGVGDDDQTIYGYSGASPGWLIDFDDYFPGASHHALTVNYRCPSPVVTAATNLLSRNTVRVPKVIGVGPRNRTDTSSLAVVTHDEPTETTLEHITTLLSDGSDPGDIVVLARVNTLLAPVQAALFEAGIPCANRDGARFLDRTGVAAALSWLTIATGPDRLGSQHIARAARRPGRSLSPRLLEWMSEQHDRAGLTRLAGRLNTEKDTEKVLGFVRDIERISDLARTAPTATLLEFVRNDIGLDRAMQTLDAAHRGRNATAHSDDLRALISLGRLHRDPQTFGRWLTEVLTGGRDDAGVQLSTVHKVKGLEWPHVIVHDASQGIFPHHLSTDIEEERRVFHVAITRGQLSVTIVADAASPSMFLTELDAPAPTPPKPGPKSSTQPSQRTDRASSTRPGQSARRGCPEIAAAPGLAVTWGGYAGEIGTADADQATLIAGRAEFALAYGSLVSIDGRPHRLVAPDAGRRSGPHPRTSAVDHENPALLEALKGWRRDRARADSVPAYVVANDKTLSEIASVRPSDARMLLGISGIGPAKLERYGDEILAVIDDLVP